jgi:acetyl esterase
VILDPQVSDLLHAAAVAARPGYHEMSVQEARAVHERNAAALNLRAEPLAYIRNIAVPGAVGPRSARIYADREPHGMPVILWLHGGGHTLGSIDGYDSICRRLARESKCMLISLDYRLAPENKFPAALDDAFAALLWLQQHATELGGDPNRLAVAGDSAGGNLSAVCALLAREHAVISLKAQLLVYPAVAPYLDFASHRLFGEGHLLSVAAIRWFQSNYLNHDAEREDWRFAPLLAADHSQLAPALVVVAGHDPLRDEGIAYANQLKNAGTAVELIEHSGMVHAFWSLARVIDEGAVSMQRAAAFLQRALYGSGEPFAANRTDQ